MQTKTISGFPHFRGLWNANYIHPDGQAGYELGAEVYGTVTDGGVNPVEAYRSLIDHNTQPLADRTAWMLYSSTEAIKGYVDEKIRENTQDLLKERATIRVATEDGTWPEGTTVHVTVITESDEVLADRDINGSEAIVLQLFPRTKYKVVSTTAVEGYATPKHQWHSAVSGRDNDITLMWRTIKAGVYIHTTDGHLIRPEAWESDSPYDVNGIYVGDGSMAVLVAPAPIAQCSWGSGRAGNTAVPGIPCVHDVSFTDFDTETNESDELSAIAWLNSYPDTLPAFQAILTGGADGGPWTFPDGRRGYLPTLRQAQLVQRNWGAINNAVLATGHIILESRNWAAAQYGVATAWHFSAGSVAYFSRLDICRVRPVADY